MINFRKHPSMTEVVIPNGITLINNKFNAQFYNMQNLVISEFNHPDVTGMFRTYQNCRNLTGAPACGENVTNMVQTYQNCTNLTGAPVCGENVTSISYAYYNCRNLTGAPACGKSVVNMSDAYEGCSNLAGPPVCGNNVTNMRYAYSNCYNLTGSSACGNNVTNMHRAYYNCMNLSAGNHYWYSSNISNALQCFHGKNNSRRYNIYVPANSTTLNTCLINNSRSLVGFAITWKNAGSYYYNTKYNIYIYPTEFGNVEPEDPF